MNKRENNGTAKIPSSDYEVGYGKPPKSGQFKKGEVRNASGRPKKAPAKLDLKEALRSRLERTREVTVGNERQLMTTLDLMIERCVANPSKTSIRDFNRTAEILRWLYSDALEKTGDGIDYKAMLKAKLDDLARRQEARHAAEEAAKAKDAGEEAKAGGPEMIY